MTNSNVFKKSNKVEGNRVDSFTVNVSLLATCSRSRQYKVCIMLIICKECWYISLKILKSSFQKLYLKSPSTDNQNIRQNNKKANYMSLKNDVSDIFIIYGYVNQYNYDDYRVDT